MYLQEKQCVIGKGCEVDRFCEYSDGTEGSVLEFHDQLINCVHSYFVFIVQFYSKQVTHVAEYTMWSLPVLSSEYTIVLMHSTTSHGLITPQCTQHIVFIISLSFKGWKG
jgi:hypothetical protein